MATFGQRFKEWLVKNGKEPFPDEIIEALDDAATDTAAWMKCNEEEIKKEMQQLITDCVEGKSVDPEARAKELADRLE